MNSCKFRPLNIFYSALTGLNLGLFLALLAAQWTWLELRVNTGLLIPVGLFVGLIIGVARLVQHPFLGGMISIGAPWLMGLFLAQGDPANLWILIGSMFREGILFPSLSLNAANALVLVLALVTLIMAWRLRQYLYASSF